MSEHISKCCGWGVHLGGIPSADPEAQVTHFYACDHCLKACDVEAVEQRDHRMRVEGAVAAIKYVQGRLGDQAAEWSVPFMAERIVREMKERAKR